MPSTLTSSSTQAKSKRTQKTRSRSQSKPPQSSPQTTLDVLCEQETLCRVLSYVGRGVPSNPVQPILGTVLFEADADTELLKLSSYNQEFGLSVEVEATINSSGTMALPHLILGQIARRLPREGELRLSCSVSRPEPEGVTTLQAVLAPVDAPDKRYELRGMLAAEFPPLPSAKTKVATLPAAAIIAVLNGSLFAASRDENKKILNGSHFVFVPNREGVTLKAWTTDGHRLVHCCTGSKAAVGGSEAAVAFTVPAAALQELLRHLEPTDTVSVYFDRDDSSSWGGTAVFEWSNKRLVCHTRLGQYPNCDDLIESTRHRHDRNLVVERVALLSTLERLALLSSKSHKTASLRTDRANRRAHLKIENSGIGSAQETLAAELEGEDVELTFNVNYLLEIVRAAGTSDIRLHLGGTKTTPVLLVPTGKGNRLVDCQYIIAPVA